MKSRKGVEGFEVAMLKVIGAGLGRTGTHSLHLALETLGLRSIHFDQERLNDVLFGANQAPDFRRYDDVDAVTDVPAAFFYHELLEAYPDAKVVLTVRDIEEWWESIRHHFTIHPITNQTRLKFRLAHKLGIDRWVWKEAPFDAFRRHLRQNVYGSSLPREFLYKKRYVEHNDQVVATVAPQRLLVMNISAGEGWEKLCPFLGLPIPDAPFPHTHQADYNALTPWNRKPPPQRLRWPAT
jgi:hypothetical protein